MVQIQCCFPQRCAFTGEQAPTSASRMPSFARESAVGAENGSTPHVFLFFFFCTKSWSSCCFGTENYARPTDVIFSPSWQVITCGNCFGTTGDNAECGDSRQRPRPHQLWVRAYTGKAPTGSRDREGNDSNPCARLFPPDMTPPQAIALVTSRIQRRASGLDAVCMWPSTKSSTPLLSTGQGKARYV